MLLKYSLDIHLDTALNPTVKFKQQKCICLAQKPTALPQIHKIYLACTDLTPTKRFDYPTKRARHLNGEMCVKLNMYTGCFCFHMHHKTCNTASKFLQKYFNIMVARKIDPILELSWSEMQQCYWNHHLSQGNEMVGTDRKRLADEKL